MTHVGVDRDEDVRALLSDTRFVTPNAPSSLGTGATAGLRNAMARFCDGDEHAAPRAAVERAIDRLSPATLTDIATRRTHSHVTATFDARDLAFVVPTEALAISLGIDDGDLASTVADVRRVVAAIGRGDDATAETDLATDRLTKRVSDHPDGSVAAISLLYQVFDSAAALFSVSLIAERTAEPRRNALAKTVRRATTDITVGDHLIEADSTIHVSLEPEGVEFGAGRHRCPGEVLAHAIVDGMLSALIDTELMTDEIVVSTDGRPDTLPMRRR